MEEKETLSEKIKRLGERSTASRISTLEKEALKEELFNLLYDKPRYEENVYAMSKTLRPLADSMSELVLQSKFTLKEMTTTAQSSRDRLEKAWDESHGAVERIRKAMKGITWRMWVTALLVGSLSGPMTLITYNLYQKYFSTEKVDVRLRRNAR